MGNDEQAVAPILERLIRKGADVVLAIERPVEHEKIDHIKQMSADAGTRFALIGTKEPDLKKVDALMAKATAVLGKPDIFIDLTTPIKNAEDRLERVGPLTDWLMARALIRSWQAKPAPQVHPQAN